MNKIGLILVLTFFLASCTKTSTFRDTIAIAPVDSQIIQSGSMLSGAMMQKNESRYRNYTPELVASALKSGQKVTLFFAASWCPSCKALDVDIRSNLGSIPADSLIVKINYDTSTDLKQKYGVTTQHTTVVLNSDGQEKSKKIGAKTVGEVLGN